MKCYQVICDECETIWSRSDPIMLSIAEGENLGMISVTLPPIKLPRHGEQVAFDFCSAECLSAFMVKRVATQSKDVEIETFENQPD